MHRRQHAERTKAETVEMFDHYIVRTGLRVPDVYNASILKEQDMDEAGEEQLVLYEKGLNEKDITVLKDYMEKTHRLLTNLHLNNNQIGPKGAEILASMLDHDGSLLSELFLNRNYIYDQGAIAIAEALKTNTRLKQLKMGGNNVKDPGAEAVAEMMLVNHSLRGLEFDANRYTSLGQGKLADALNKNKGLKVVQVGEAYNIMSRLAFVKMMIQTEDEANPRTSTILCFSKDRNNEIIDLLLQEWRVCRKEGKELISLPREKIEKFRKFNRYSEGEMKELHDDVYAFLREARESGVQDLNLAKILVMGRAAAGKTSLVQSVVRQRSALTGDGPDRATASVDIKPFTISNAKCTFWDFGGQEEYYMTHTFFVTPRCVVIICVNLEEYKDSSDSFSYQVQYFVDSIQSHAPGAKFIIVGTHADQTTRNDQAALKKSLEKRFETIEQANFDAIQRELDALQASNNPEAGGKKKQEKPRTASDPQQRRRAFTGNSRVSEASTSRQNRRTNYGKVVTSRQLGASTLDELNVVNESDQEEHGRLGKNQPHKRNISGTLLKKATKQTLFETAGMTVVDEANVKVVNPMAKKPKTNQKPGKLGLATQSIDNLDAGPPDAKEKLKQEAVEKLQKRRDNRPKLIEVCITSSTVAMQGISKLRTVLKTALIDKKEEYGLSDQLPSPYALLYEAITGHQIILTNPNIKDYDITMAKSFAPDPKQPGYIPLRSVKRQISKKFSKPEYMGNPKKSHRKTGLTINRKSKKQMDEIFGHEEEGERSPIIEMSQLYEMYVTKTVHKRETKGIRATMTLRRKKKAKKKALFNSHEDLHLALRTLHEIGYILWYEDNDRLRDIVFVDPQWVVRMIKTVIRHNMFEEGEGSLGTVLKPESMTPEEFVRGKDQFRETAVLDSRLLYCFDVWKSATVVERYHMLSLMQSFDLLCEQARQTDRDSIPKYFVPVYLKIAFQEGGMQDNLQRMEALEKDIINNCTKVPQFTRSLFSSVEMGPQMQSQGPSLLDRTAFFEDEEDMVRPKNIQWRYEFNNFFPEGLFLRLLVRSQPFLSFYEEYKPTETFVVGRTGLGTTIFLQVEKAKYGLKGALILTAIQANAVFSESFSFNMSDIWQNFSLFAFEIEDLLSAFPGLDTKVFVSVVRDGVGKVTIPREKLEVEELLHNSNPRHQYKNLDLQIGVDTSVPLHYLIPPLYVLPRDAQETKKNADVTFTTPELVRLSKVARIHYGLLSIDMQRREMDDSVESKKSFGGKSRVHILYKQLITYTDDLLKLMCKAINPNEKLLIRSFDESLQFIHNSNPMELESLEQNIRSMRSLEQSSFMIENNTLTQGHLDDAIRTCFKLFDLLEQKMTLHPRSVQKRRRNRGL